MSLLKCQYSLLKVKSIDGIFDKFKSNRWTPCCWVPIDSSGLFSVENIVPTVSVLCVCLLLWGSVIRSPVSSFPFGWQFSDGKKRGRRVRRSRKRRPSVGKLTWCNCSDRLSLARLGSFSLSDSLFGRKIKSTAPAANVCYSTRRREGKKKSICIRCGL